MSSMAMLIFAFFMLMPLLLLMLRFLFAMLMPLRRRLMATPLRYYAFDIFPSSTPLLPRLSFAVTLVFAITPLPIAAAFSPLMLMLILPLRRFHLHATIACRVDMSFSREFASAEASASAPLFYASYYFRHAAHYYAVFHASHHCCHYRHDVIFAAPRFRQSFLLMLAYFSDCRHDVASRRRRCHC